MRAERGPEPDVQVLADPDAVARAAAERIADILIRVAASRGRVDIATTGGSTPVGIYRQLRIPIYFVGLGEQAEDLQPFEIENYANAVFGLD